MNSLVVYEHHTKPFIGFELDDTLSLNSRPLVSNGKSNTHIPERRITTSNSRMDAVWWHPCTKATATRGHIIPPILPIALATPTPVVRTEVGYIYSSNKDIEIRYLVVGSNSKSFSWISTQLHDSDMVLHKAIFLGAWFFPMLKIIYAFVAS